LESQRWMSLARSAIYPCISRTLHAIEEPLLTRSPRTAAAFSALRRKAGLIPPVSAKMRCIDEWFRSNSWAICWKESPFCQRSHINFFWLSVNRSEVSASSATLLLLTQNSVVLHRPVESTAKGSYTLTPNKRPRILKMQHRTSLCVVPWCFDLDPQPDQQRCEQH
jgi:hypothetical protein